MLTIGTGWFQLRSPKLNPKSRHSTKLCFLFLSKFPSCWSEFKSGYRKWKINASSQNIEMCTKIRAAQFSFFFYCLLSLCLWWLHVLHWEVFSALSGCEQEAMLWHRQPVQEQPISHSSIPSTLCCPSLSVLFKERLWGHSEFLLEHKSLENNHRHKLNCKHCVYSYVRTHFQRK